nr:LicD family protein [uncultured Parolsenella sp.]
MSLKYAVKMGLPSSYAQLSALGESVDAIRSQMLTASEARQIHDELHWDISVQLLGEIRALRNELDAHDSQMKMFAWENYRKENESIDDAKKRFFRSLPKATGGMRLLQLGYAKLVGEFDALCRENGLQYWAVYGTLLGAIRHGGFIPWDDDTDLGMMRSDIERLIEIVGDDDRYRITVVYDRCVTCKQIRFLYADTDIPCFLDLFVYDWAVSPDRQKAEELRGLRAELAEEIECDNVLSFWGPSPYYPDAADGADRIRAHFEDCRQKSRDCGVVCDKEKAGGIVWAVDNLNCSRTPWYAYSLEDMFPLKRAMFEGVEINVPANADAYLRSCYGDYLDLPKDIHSHFRHVSHDDLEAGATRDALSGFAE